MVECASKSLGYKELIQDMSLPVRGKQIKQIRWRAVPAHGEMGHSKVHCENLIRNSRTFNDSLTMDFSRKCSFSRETDWDVGVWSRGNKHLRGGSWEESAAQSPRVQR